MELPQDPYILMSFINLKLRDFYANLDELCKKEDIEKEWLIEKMKSIGMEYSAENNKFW